jgi:hypothetical protein
MTIHLDISAVVHRRAGLTVSLSIKSLCEDFGHPPISIRSPDWCPLGPGAVAALIGASVAWNSSPSRAQIDAGIYR